jgi:hypothetical protein
MTRSLLLSLALAVGVLTLSPEVADAEGYADIKITKVEVQSGRILIESAGLTFRATSTPPCSSNWAWIRQDSSTQNWQQMYQLALTALLSGKKVRVYVASSCSGSPAYPWVQEIDVY